MQPHGKGEANPTPKKKAKRTARRNKNNCYLHTKTRYGGPPFRAKKKHYPEKKVKPAEKEMRSPETEGVAVLGSAGKAVIHGKGGEKIC